MNPLLLLLVVAGISLVGSLQAGAVNLSVLGRALTRRAREARWLALGGSLPEAFYAALAVAFDQWLGVAEQLRPWLLWGFPILLAALAIYYWFRATPSTADRHPTAARSSGAFATGLALAAANPQLLPFWLAVSQYMRAQGWLLAGSVHSIVFCVGAWLGALVLLLAVAWAGSHWQITPTPRRLRQLDQLTSLIFLLLASAALIAALVAS